MKILKPSRIYKEIEEIEHLFHLFLNTLNKKDDEKYTKMWINFINFILKNKDDINRKIGYIRAFVDGEGCVAKTFISMSNTELNLLKDIQKDLLIFGINSSIYKLKRYNEKNKQGYSLQINNRVNMLRFYRYIGLNDNNKKQKLYNNISKYL